MAADLWFGRRDQRTGELVRDALPPTDALERYGEITRLAPWMALAVAVICDGCGRREPLRAAQAPSGWTTASGRDLCAGCAP